MSEINSAIALSDLHLGNKDSYLYSKDPNYEKNLDALITLLKDLGPQDELILNGDFLELSLAGLDEVYEDVEKFFDLLAKERLYERIVFIPGNHDHHFWRELGEEVYVNGRIRQSQDPPGNYKYPCCFVDERFSNEDQDLPCEIVLSYLWPNNGIKCPEIVVKYPHHLIKIGSDTGIDQHYLFTHGHFLEDLFKPINYLITPHHLEELEAFNNLWLELFDYHIGHSGRLSDTARNLEQAYKKGEREARKAINEALNSVCDSLKQSLHLSWWQVLLVKAF